MAKVSPAPKSTIPVSLAHLNDSIGYELPHAIEHLRRTYKAKNAASRKYDFKHAQGHLEKAMLHNQKLTNKLMTIPSVRKVLFELEKDRAKSDGIYSAAGGS